MTEPMKVLIPDSRGSANTITSENIVMIQNSKEIWELSSVTYDKSWI